ncbi:hypothetical protein E2C01_047744 [Portunus trituberculatus]|uniref:Uncharacterized protein n=1 Tax=Portunus trituberculatus TaxID=210409 RepID=A0A5B7G1W2_PORTR|nr:hypothetical protein [Portunus trituberculatus]
MKHGKSGAPTYQQVAELSGAQFEIVSGTQFENASCPCFQVPCSIQAPNTVGALSATVLGFQCPAYEGGAASTRSNYSTSLFDTSRSSTSLP